LQGRVSLVVVPLLVVAIGAVIYLLVLTQPQKQAQLQETPPATVVVDAVHRVDLTPMAEVMGTLVPARVAALHFQLAGQVVGRHVDAGHRVVSGTLLMTLEDGESRDQLSEAQARLEQERAAVVRDRRLLNMAVRQSKLQRKEAKRLTRLGNDSLASRSLLDEATQRLIQLEQEEERRRFDVNAAKARIKQREAELSRAQRRLAFTRLVAPFDGVVNVVYLQAGDYATAGEPAVELIQFDVLELRVELRREVAAALSVDQAVDVWLDERQLSGRIVALQRDPDPQTWTYAARIRLDKTGVLPGGAALAKLPLRVLKQVMVVPAAAVLRESGISYLFVVVEGDHLRRVAVDLGRRQGALQVVKSGVAEGDRVVARDVAALSDGQRVTVLPDVAGTP